MSNRTGTLLRPMDERNETRITKHLMRCVPEFQELGDHVMPYRYVFDRIFTFGNGAIAQTLEIKTNNSMINRFPTLHVELNKFERALEFMRYGIESWIAICGRDRLYFRRLDLTISAGGLHFKPGNAHGRGQHGNLFFDVPLDTWEIISVPDGMEWEHRDD